MRTKVFAAYFPSYDQAGKLAFPITQASGRRASGRQMGGDSFNPSTLPLDPDVEDYGEDFEFDNISTLMGESDQPLRPSWIEPDHLNLKHRIGRGLFGDVWLATIHNNTVEFDEYHEVAVKMLPLISDDNLRTVVGKFETLYQAFQAARNLERVSWPRGMSAKNGKACIVLKFYDGSVGDRMALLPENRLSLQDALRYGKDIIEGIMELHSCGLLALNLKPCNFLVDNQDSAILGEFGTPILCFDNSATKSQPVPWMGTPNYMAPEQWGPSLRGPISSETDAWGFAASMVEMVTGSKPWDGMTADEIYNAVVGRRQKPTLPGELPPAVYKVLKACFEYDYRHRPHFKDILNAFKSPDEIFKEGDWICVKDRPSGECTKIGIVKAVVGSDSVYLQSCDKPGERLQITGAGRLSLWKDKFQIDDPVKVKQSVLEPRFGWPQGSDRTQGTVKGFKDQDGIVLVGFPGSIVVWRADPVELERVSAGFVAGDWVFLRGGWPVDADAAAEGRRISRIGVVHYVESDTGNLKVAFQGRETLWTGVPTDFEKVLPLSIGQFIRLRSDVVKPHFDWPVKEHGGGWDMGRIVNIVPNGGLQVDFPGRFWNSKGWWADPDEVEVVRIQEVEGIVQKYQHVESMHWGIRPLLSLIGVLVAARIGIIVVNVVSKPFQGKKEEEQSKQPEQKQGAPDPKDSTNPANPAWLPPQVATLIFREGNSTAR
ncbi:unnamed protein product [Calypogeia fissa]